MEKQINIQKSQNLNQLNLKNPFSKGMTLQQYIKTKIDTFDQNNINNQDQKYLDSIMGELVVQPAQNNRLVTFQIKQIDQDNYQQSRQGNKKQSFKLAYSNNNKTDKINGQRKSLVLQSIQTKKESLPIHSGSTKGNQKIRHFSNSPYKSKSPVKNMEMFRSLYGNEYTKAFKKFDGQQMLHNTLYSKSIFPNLKKDFKYFQNKNKKQYKQIVNYESMLASKYGIKFLNQNNNMAPVINNFRIQGTKDKYFQRKRGIANGII